LLETACQELAEDVPKVAVFSEIKLLMI
jgi:hypothetical protein